MNTLLSIPHYEDRTILYQVIGVKYGRKWGVQVLRWFMERNLDNRTHNIWITRWELFSTEFQRKIPMSSLYMALDRLTRDGILEMKVDDGAHHFRVHKNAMAIVDRLIELARSE